MEIIKKSITVNDNTAIGHCIKAATRTRSGSLSYIRRITKATCEHILFSRLNIQRNLFKSMLINGKKYQVLRSRVNNQLLNDFKEMLNGLLKLIDRDYVSEARMFFVKKDDPKNPIESYVFRYIAEDNDVYTNFDLLKKVTRELGETTIKMFDNVFHLDDNYEVLDLESIGIYFTVTYRNGKHPINIDSIIRCKRVEQAVGELLITKSAENFPHCYAMGKMKTGHHSVKINAKGQVYEPNVHRMEIESPEMELQAQAEPQPDSELQHEAEKLVDCLCGISVVYDKIEMLHCAECLTYQHGVCVGYRCHREFPPWYLCSKCNVNIQHPTSEIACIRLAIALCHEYQGHPGALFPVQPFSVRKSLYSWFTQHKLHTRVGNEYKINLNIVNEELLKRIFRKS